MISFLFVPLISRPRSSMCCCMSTCSRISRLTCSWGGSKTQVVFQNRPSMRHHESRPLTCLGGKPFSVSKGQAERQGGTQHTKTPSQQLPGQLATWRALRSASQATSQPPVHSVSFSGLSDKRRSKPFHQRPLFLPPCLIVCSRVAFEGPAGQVYGAGGCPGLGPRCPKLNC
ncbi:hypothetical protein EV126DRAFT_216585 [Verticillium dahliae]|nr:hypothetical protein EV126DRAFT_216585 [Verticillium dahliae]